MPNRDTEMRMGWRRGNNQDLLIRDPAPNPVSETGFDDFDVGCTGLDGMNLDRSNLVGMNQGRASRPSRV